MFVIATNPTFNHRVEVSVPVDGGHEKQSFTTRFRVLPSDKEPEYDLGTTTGSTDFLKAIVDDMGDLVDGDNKPVAYNDRLRDQMISLPFIRMALVRTYFSAIGKALEGN